MDFESKVNDIYNKKMEEFSPAVKAIKIGARGKDSVEQVKNKNVDFER